jgi:hypothetical protein
MAQKAICWAWRVAGERSCSAQCYVDQRRTSLGAISSSSASSPSIHSAWRRRLACFESASGILRPATRPCGLGIIRPKETAPGAELGPWKAGELVPMWPGTILKLTSLNSVPSPTYLAALRIRRGHFAFARRGNFTFACILQAALQADDRAP